MISYICKVLFVAIIEISILWGISSYFEFDIITILFLGSAFLALFAFMIGASGDFFTKRAEMGVFRLMAGAYTPKHEKITLRVGPFLVGSILSLILSFILAYI
ncbi:hypothetical protein ACFFF5_06915 [Lederbergia wuyishanensis]|uniref:DUF3899 domain-containing protein n=1 Tax=Lederbergia wuyishanensis TaxID=1347903 RepID=A0ABU0D2M1_9BACI|nr:hypothetical protein [Lederbergia wuyishanensis]MCJ8007220.1 hypothetical protein [Lederbergia wuyishanensis]MDQ0342630.1 hypothetical protein [Lederbergia wuyishanensis]